MLTSLTFLQDLPLYKTERPYYFVERLPEVPESKTSNCHYETRDNVPLIDVRGMQDKFTLEENGWEYLNHKSMVSLKSDEYIGDGHCQSTVDKYLHECVAIVQARYPVSKIICFDWRVRQSNATNEDVNTVNRSRSRQSVQTPARTVHCDYSISGGYKRLVTHLIAEEYEQVNQGKLRPHFVNIWRPLKTVTSSPILFGDPRTILSEDLVEVDKVSADSVEFGIRLKNTIRPDQPDQLYYWLSDQRPDEPVMFISWDPRDSGIHAGYPPHSAAMEIFDENGLSTRVSMEVRTIVLTAVEEGQN